MDNVMIKNAQGEQMSINVVRYFRLNGIEYLVFSLNEVDEGGYVKLYIAKIDGNFANTISDDVEWNLIKDTVKSIIKSNKDNMPLSIVDLDLRKLTNIQIIDQKVFKLSESFIQLLGANKKVEAYEETAAASPVLEVNPVIEENSVDNLNSIQQNPIVESSTVPAVEEFIQSVPVEPVLSQVELPTVETQTPVTENNVMDNTGVVDVDPTPVVSEFAQENPVESFGQKIDPSDTTTNKMVENNSNIEGFSDYGLDYKTLYENEINKNKSLTEEIEKYKSVINELKSVINNAETF